MDSQASIAPPLRSSPARSATSFTASSRSRANTQTASLSRTRAAFALSKASPSTRALSSSMRRSRSANVGFIPSNNAPSWAAAARSSTSRASASCRLSSASARSRPAAISRRPAIQPVSDHGAASSSLSAEDATSTRPMNFASAAAGELPRGPPRRRTATMPHMRSSFRAGSGSCDAASPRRTPSLPHADCLRGRSPPDGHRAGPVNA